MTYKEGENPSFSSVLEYLSNKKWELVHCWEDEIDFLKSKLKDPNIDMDTTRAIKNYTKIFKQPLVFKHDLTTYKTGRIYARYVLLPNKPILNIYLKELIVPKEDYLFVSFDFKASQIRHMALYKDLQNIKEMFEKRIDPYNQFAKELNITRNEAKLSILLLSYGGSEATIQKELPLLNSKKICKLYNKWFETENDTYSEKVKLNHIIQKLEVDFFKEKLLYLYEKQDHRFNLHAFIHDDIILEVRRDYLFIISTIKEYLEKSEEIPMEVDVKISTSFQFEKGEENE